MKERKRRRAMRNEYDNEQFFREYAKMARSRDGLRSAGEWHQLKPLFPPLQGRTFLIWDAGTAGTANSRQSRERYGYWDLT